MVFSRKAQHVLYGSMFMMLIFFMAILFVVNYMFVSPRANNEDFRFAQQEAVRASNALMSSGYPQDWVDINSVLRAGIVDNGRVNHTKLDELRVFVTFNEGNYQSSKALLGVEREYLITIRSDSYTAVLTSPGRYQDEAEIEAAQLPTVASQKRFALIEIPVTGDVETAEIKVIVYSD